MENSNTTIKTTGGHEIVLKTFITGREKRFINDAFLEGVELTGGQEKPNFTIPGTKANVVTDRAIQSVVVSVDGKTENVLDAVLDLPAADSDEVIAAVNEITGDKKKGGNTSTP